MYYSHLIISSFSIWNCGENTDNANFNFKLIDNIDGDIHIIGEKLINPNDDGIVLALAAYSPEISQNFRKYLEFLMFVIPIGVFLTMGVIREYEDIKEIPFDKKSELVEEIIKDKEENKDNLSNENKDTNINNVEKEEIQPMKKKGISYSDKARKYRTFK